MKKGVLIMAYGAPNKMEDVEPFYTDIRGGKKPSPELLEELVGRYKLIGGKSPLLEITTAQANGLQERLGEEYKVYVGMRHWEPWIPQVMQIMKKDGVEEILALVMAPHYSKMSIGKYMNIVEQTNLDNNYKFKIHKIENWHTHPLFIKALSKKTSEAMEKFSEEEQKDLMVFFTAHSLPVRIREWNDPYENQLNETSRLVAEKLNIKKWKFAFQSAGRTPEPWLGPDIVDAISNLSVQNGKAALVCVVGFIADHLEVIYDIDIEAKPEAEKIGVHLERIDMLNDNSTLINCFEEIVREKF